MKNSTFLDVNGPKKHPKCKGYSSWTDYGYEYDCGYNTDIPCEDCKYGLGDKEPETEETL